LRSYLTDEGFGAPRSRFTGGGFKPPSAAAVKYANNADPGGGVGYIQGIPRLDIPDLNISDSGTGPGSSKQKSSTFPATIALAASWNRQLSFE
jgi:beta-glucosidase-like glycosyl hydrolase